ncbi:hypothetical protein Cgig2_013482 [Carnegiea gigantea]|uniref:GPI-anchored protein LLG1-like domain-containing protein n=1 Tax=Carnegiea gigantea TaxID=171969 RepID=A0A9Q1GMA7_9CARY|nr:hypothetical protein Cgig2_013482 [Carnegiea gigantea]
MSFFADCPVNFENQNYTIITSKCKGPKYTADLCCSAFKEFACPFAEQINDMSTNCADTMFSYINLYGKYPPGIFANLCKGDKYGLACDDVKSENVESKDSKTNSAHIGNALSPMAAVLAGSLVFLVKMTITITGLILCLFFLIPFLDNPALTNVLPLRDESTYIVSFKETFSSCVICLRK